jgi:hypothetical protein
MRGDGETSACEIWNRSAGFVFRSGETFQDCKKIEQKLQGEGDTGGMRRKSLSSGTSLACTPHEQAGWR